MKSRNLLVITSVLVLTVIVIFATRKPALIKSTVSQKPAVTETHSSNRPMIDQLKQGKDVAIDRSRGHTLPTKEALLSDLPLTNPNDKDFINQLAQLSIEDSSKVGTQRDQLKLNNQEIDYLTDLITLAHAAQLTYQRRISTVKQQNANVTIYSIPNYPVEGSQIRDYIIKHASADLGWGAELAGQYVALLLPREMQYFGKYQQQIIVEEQITGKSHPGYSITHSVATDIGSVTSTSFIGIESARTNSGELCLYIPHNKT